MKKLIVIFLCISFAKIQAQINPNTLFLVINKDNPHYLEINNSYVSMKVYTIDNPTPYLWRANFSYFSKATADYPARYILTLPKKMLNDFKQRQKVLFVKEEEPKWYKMTFDEFSKTISYLAPYYTEIFFNDDSQKYETEKRYNIFIIKEEDYEKDHIPCYETLLYITSTDE